MVKCETYTVAWLKQSHLISRLGEFSIIADFLVGFIITVWYTITHLKYPL